MSCAIKLLFLSGVLIEYKFNKETAEDLKDQLYIAYLDEKYLEQKKKAERICDKKNLH